MMRLARRWTERGSDRLDVLLSLGKPAEVPGVLHLVPQFGCEPSFRRVYTAHIVASHRPFHAHESLLWVLTRLSVLDVLPDIIPVDLPPVLGNLLVNDN